MSRVERNQFGPIYPLHDEAALVEMLGIAPEDRVLEVGGAGNPFGRAQVVCDLTFGSCAQRNGAPAVLREDVTYVEAPAESLPFADGEFDFVYCTQVLEHVRDPEAAARELSRVARRGFVEVPSRFGELLNGNPTHRWIVDREGDGLVFHPRAFVDHPLRNFFYGALFQDDELRRLSEETWRNLFNHQVLFEGQLSVEVRPAAGQPFDYEDPKQAAQAHYGFALNCLRGGADPTYAFPDALEAVRLAPESAPARCLLAIHHARLQRPADALAALEGVGGDLASELRRLLEHQADGAYLDPDHLPLPGADLELETELPAGEAAARPRVSVVIAGRDPGLLRIAAESALTQDYPETEVLVARAGEGAELERVFDGLRMGERLRLVTADVGAGLAASFNQGALAATGDLFAFLREGDRMLPHHLDRLVAELFATGAGAVHSDRLLTETGGVVSVPVVPGRPETAGASVSTLVARRRSLESTGFFAEDKGEPEALQDFLLRLAATGGLHHLKEATVMSARALPEGVSALEPARAAMGLDALELLRSLMAAHAREEGLRARIAELETRRDTEAREDAT